MQLNDAQKQAYMTNNQHVLVLAGAGTGKTHTMIHRIHRIVSEESVNPNSILALTFTNAAAFEMEERYMKLSGGGECPAFHTFHAFCYSLMSENIRVRQKVGYDKLPDITDEATIKTIKRNLKTDLSISLSISKLDGDGKNLSMKDKATYDVFHKALQKKLRTLNVISFDMLIDRVCGLFRSNDESIHRYLKKFYYIFIDEFQDTDPLQWEFAKCFKDSNIFIIGDALQAIYGFRGADSSIIKSIADDNGWEVIKLYENYRSTAPIIQFANNISKCNDDSYRVELKAFKSGLDVVEIYENISYQFEDSTLSKIKDYCESYPGSTAVLVRTNKEVSQIRSYLADNGVECSSNDDYSDVRHILKSTFDDDYMFNWLMSSMSQEDHASVRRLLMIDEDTKPKTDDILKLPICPDKIRIKAKKVMDVQDILSSDDFEFCKCEAALKYLGIKGITVLPTGTSPQELAEYLLSELDNVETKSIYVGTVHSSKGLEYDNVCVAGVDGPNFQIRSEEDNNLYYVAVTRAKDHLLVIHGW